MKRSMSRRTSSKRQDHNWQKKGFFPEQQLMLSKRIDAKRARGLMVTGTYCKITMMKLVRELGDIPSAKKFKATDNWFNKFCKRWGYSFQEKTNVKKKSVAARVPYVKKFHQYLLYKALYRSALSLKASNWSF